MNQNIESRREAIRCLASIALLPSLLIGIPILLIVGVGWPLSQEIPSGSDIFIAIKTGAIPPLIILKSISLVVWALWFQMLVGVGIEAWAHLHGRVAPRVVFIPSFIQRFSARMMGTVLFLVFSIQNPGISLADNQELLAPTTIEMDVESSETKSLIHTVERCDSLRVLAERYLGDPDRWTEVFVLNQGQSQEDGESLTDPARLQPGWELIMPTDARVPTSAKLQIDEVPDRSHQPGSALPELHQPLVTVQEGDTLWGLAAHHLNDPERWVDIFNSNQDIIQEPDVILPGWQLQIPAHETEPTVAEPPIHSRPDLADHPAPQSHSLPKLADHPAPVAAYTTAKPTVVASIPLTDGEQTSAPSRQTLFAVGGLGVFASSLGWVLARLRRTQRRRMPTGRMPLPPSGKAVQLDQELQAASDPDGALFLDASLRVMSSRVAGDSPPNIIGVTLESESVSIHLSTPAQAPPGFHTSKDGMTWTLLRDPVLEHLQAEADGVPAPLPTLATIGKRNGNEYLLNLEHMVALNLEGDSEAIIDLCAAMAAQLASSHLADDLTVMCVGFGHDLTVLQRVEHVPDVTSAIEQIGHQQRQNQALLGSHPPPLDSRIGNSGDYWHPTVVLAANRLSEEEASGLLKACGSSVCVVAHGLEGATWVGQFDEYGLQLEPTGLRLEPHGLSSHAAAAFTELASSAKDTEGVALAVPPTPHLMQLKHSTSASDPLAVDVEVRVMGTVDVLGAAQPFTSRRALDLVAYLAFHPAGADRDQLKAQIWPPDDPPSESTLANTVSRARKALGVNDDDEPYLPRVSPEGIYRLRTEVGTDVGRFEALVSAARNDPSEHGRQQLQFALDLVRGTPFTGGAGDMYRWADFGLRTQIDCLVDTAAHELAKRCIDAGDFQGARTAVMTSLRLVGVCEQCYRLRLMAAAENPTEVRQIMVELMGLLKRESDQPEADDLISSDLLELYEQLMSSRLLLS